MLVCHRCDNPKCVRPDHLFLGTHSDNAKDCASKGRNVAQRRPEVRRGTANGCAKLTPEQVQVIRRRRDGGERLDDIGRDYGVSRDAVWRIGKRLNWAWLKEIA
jgi:DNA invertase Pin-like site-specific DNA recombinase